VGGFFSEIGSRLDMSIGCSSRENVKLEISREYSDQYIKLIKLIKKYIRLVPTERLFNIDESGFSDSEEGKPNRILIPIKAKPTTLHFPPSRKIHHQTPVC
jgi:hypothetical protein